eukprot:910906-Prorocentrum_minimum.AAC.1
MKFERGNINNKQLFNLIEASTLDGEHTEWSSAVGVLAAFSDRAAAAQAVMGLLQLVQANMGERRRARADINSVRKHTLTPPSVVLKHDLITHSVSFCKKLRGTSSVAVQRSWARHLLQVESKIPIKAIAPGPAEEIVGLVILVCAAKVCPRGRSPSVEWVERTGQPHNLSCGVYHYEETPYM